MLTCKHTHTVKCDSVLSHIRRRRSRDDQSFGPDSHLNFEVQVHLVDSGLVPMTQVCPGQEIEIGLARHLSLSIHTC